MEDGGAILSLELRDPETDASGVTTAELVLRNQHALWYYVRPNGIAIPGASLRHWVMVPPCSLTEIVKLNCDNAENSLGRVPLVPGTHVDLFADGIGSSPDGSRIPILTVYGAEIFWRLATNDPLPIEVGDALQDDALQMAEADEEALAAVPQVAHFYAIAKAATTLPPDPVGLQKAINDAAGDEAVQQSLGLHVSKDVVAQIAAGIRIERIAEVPDVLAIEEFSQFGAPFGQVSGVLQTVAGGPLRAKAVTQEVAWDPGWPIISQLFNVSCCSKSGSDTRNNCVAGGMQRNGASAQAIDFARARGWAVIPNMFQPVGLVDLVVRVCTFGTNFNCGYSYFIVNGDPAAIEVGWREPEPSLTAAVSADPVLTEFSADIGSFQPFWQGEDVFDGVQHRGDRSTLLFWSPMKTCHACGPVGRIYVVYDFDATGHFLGRRVDRVTKECDQPVANSNFPCD